MKSDMTMTVAVTRTKAEQALSQSFEAVAAKLPGGRAVAEARKAAIGAFAALGLPHRRIEEWKYTDLRSALKEALPPAVGGARQACTAPRSMPRWKTLAALDAHRVVFVDGAHAPELSTAGALPRGWRSRRWRRRLPSRRPCRRWPDPRERRRPGSRDRAQHRLHDRRRASSASPSGARLDKPLLLVFARAGTEGAPRHHAQRRRASATGARATVIEAHVDAAGCRRPARPTR